MMTIYTPWRTLDELYGNVPESLDDYPSTGEQDIRWDDDEVMYIVGLAEKSSEKEYEDTLNQRRS